MADGQLIKPGMLEFQDTRGTGNVTVEGLVLSPAVRIEAKAGRMVVFPAWLPHFVHPVIGDDLRIAIACNCNILGYKPPEK